MAGTAATVTQEFATTSEVEELRASLNKLTDDLELVRSKLVAHGAVAHAAVTGCDAANLAGYKVNVR